MTEFSRTITYVLTGCAALLAAWLARPAQIVRASFDDSGQRFFAEFDPLAAKSLEIVNFSEATATRKAFKVAQQNGRWLIPSHENYPADAQDHLARAASSVMDLTKGTTISDSPADHDLYGVADPSADSAKAGAGTRVTLKDANGGTLVDLIFGKTVKDAQGLRYARVPDKDRVYLVKVETDQLTTKFEDWIERDLLKLNANTITDVTVDDYSVDKLAGKIDQRDRMVIHRREPTPAAEGEPAPPEWVLENLGSGETLQTQKLDDMRNALADLRIIDVHRKPAGMSNQLQQSGNFKLDPESIASLEARGFYLAQTNNGYTLASNQGEISLHTNEGVEYVLRFGEVVNIEAGSDLAADPSSSANATQNGRYLFVTTNFDLNSIPKPQLAEVPASQPAAEGAASQPEDPARQAIIAANQQKKDEYDRTVKAGQDRVAELNARFADWYYVVSDNVYQKLRFKRSDLVSSASTAPAAAPEPAEHSTPPASP
jgi:hypothetical protein